jgi:hypothetical protein
MDRAPGSEEVTWQIGIAMAPAPLSLSLKTVFLPGPGLSCCGLGESLRLFASVE